MNEFNEYIGKTFNRLTILRILDQPDIKGRTLCECKCTCGNTCIRPIHNVIEGSVKSCGCLRVEKAREAIKKSLVGKRFGRLLVIRESGRTKHGNIVYTCKCDCGNTKDIIGSNLKRGLTQSCGCYQSERRSTAHAKDISGQRFGQLVAIEPTSMRSGSFIVWKCHCNYCGRDAYIPLGRLMNGQQSCGKCSYQRDLASKRMTIWKTDLEKALAKRFNGMLVRCYNKKDKNYADYGGRGIYICKEWTDDRRNFVDWGLKTGFRPDLYIDRIDNDGPYAPWNCRWVSGFCQANNTRKNRFFDIMGHRGTISDWAFLIDRKPTILYQLSRVDLEGSDLKEYIQYRWGMYSNDERTARIAELNEKKGVTSCLVPTI